MYIDVHRCTLYIYADKLYKWICDAYYAYIQCYTYINIYIYIYIYIVYIGKL